MTETARYIQSTSWRHLGGILSKPIWFFLGFAFLKVWTQLLYSERAIALPAGGALTFPTAHIFFSLTGILCGIVVALAAIRVSPLCSLSKTLYCTGALGSLSIIGLHLVAYDLIDAQWYIPLFVVVAVCNTWITIAWYESIATQGITGALACFIIGTLIGSVVLKAGILSLPPEAIITCMVVLPILSALSIHTPSENTTPLPAGRLSVKQAAHNTPLALIATVGLVHFSVGSLVAFHLNREVVSNAPLDIVISNLISAFFVLFPIILAYCLYRRNIAMAFYIAIPCLLLSSILLALGMLEITEILKHIIRTGSRLVEYTVVFLLIDLILKQKTSSSFAFGLLIGTKFCGELLGQISYPLLVDNHTMIAVIAMACLVIAALLIFTLKGFLATREYPAADRAAGHEKLAAEFKLSSRECDVLGLWLGGYSSPFIEKELGISKSTVKTHLTHIYSKTGTRNKEELLLLFKTNSLQGRL